MKSITILSHVLVVALAIILACTTTIGATKPTPGPGRYSRNGEQLLRSTCGQQGMFCFVLQDFRIKIPKYLNPASDLWHAPLGNGKSGASVFVTDKHASGTIEASCRGGHSSIIFDFNNDTGVSFKKGRLTAWFISNPNKKLTKQSIAIQGKKQGGDTLHVRCT